MEIVSDIVLAIIAFAFGLEVGIFWERREK